MWLLPAHERSEAEDAEQRVVAEKGSTLIFGFLFKGDRHDCIKTSHRSVFETGMFVVEAGCLLVTLLWIRYGETGA